MRFEAAWRAAAVVLLLAGLSRAAWAQTPQIAAVVNNEVITTLDVANRARLFALATGLEMTQAVIARLAPQILSQLIDEALEKQEIARQQIAVPDALVAKEIRNIESSAGMPPGSLRQEMESHGIAFGTMVDQIRTRLGWTEVLRKRLGAAAQPSAADVAAALARLKQDTGQTEYALSEIFIPIDSPRQAADARRFADTVIAQLRAGAPFPVVAAQFSRSQSALHGGDLGWVQSDSLDPAVVKLVREMPQGAITNPVPVAGGLEIVGLNGKRIIGNDPGTRLDLREVFLPFPTPFDPQGPTAEQSAAIEKARSIAARVHSCPEMEQAAVAAHSPRPANPGPVRLETITPPAFQALLAHLPIGHSSEPLVAADGVMVTMVCDRRQVNFGIPSASATREQIFVQRVDLGTQQLLSDLRRNATIQVERPGGV